MPATRSTASAPTAHRPPLQKPFHHAPQSLGACQHNGHEHEADAHVPVVGPRADPRLEPDVDGCAQHAPRQGPLPSQDRKSTRLNSSHVKIWYAVFYLKK